MKYLGSKRRIANDILKIILKDKENTQHYVEPFVGGCNVIDKVNGLRIASDINEYVIAMWKAFQRGWLPPTYVSEKLYNEIKEDKSKFEPELVGFVGVACTFGSKWYRGYARNSRGTNYAMEGRSNLLKQIELIKDVQFYHLDYSKLVIPNNSIVYCDIPYENTTDGYISKFDYNSFWEWCRIKTVNNNLKIYVSEYNAPKDFTLVWNQYIKTNMDASVMKTSNEKLFTYIAK